MGGILKQVYLYNLLCKSSFEKPENTRALHLN